MRRSRFLSVWLLAGLAFLYGPIAVLVATSFNDSRLMTVWTGTSFRWYAVLWRDPILIDAAWLSLRIAVASASLATLLGGLAGIGLARLGRFRGRGGFEAILLAPLVLPDLLIGLALLLLFVAMEQLVGFPRGRGAGTVILAHTTLGMAYVALIVRARLIDAGTTLEEAAADLGAAPIMVLRRITIPLAAPALAAGWLLAFTLSLDDVVIASFTSGPGATTLPMAVFSALRLGPTPVLNALASVVLALGAGALVAFWVLGKGRKKAVLF
jgi:putrescine transport system permease protein